MNFRQFLEIKNPPWEGLGYYEQKAKELESLEAKLAGFDDYWYKAKNLVNDVHSPNTWREIDFFRGIWWALSFATEHPYSVTLRDFLKEISMYDGDFHGQNRRLEYLAKPLPKRDVYYRGNREFFTLAPRLRKELPQVLKALEENKEYFKGGKYDTGDYPTYQEAVELVKKSVEGIEALMKYAFVLIDIKENTETWLERRGISYERQFSAKLKMPTHKEKEVLYHATVAMSAVQKEGFKVRKDTGVEGLGGGADHLISFTSSFRLAMELARCFKEIILISQGKIKYEDIIGWAKEDGLDIEDLERFAHRMGMSDSSPEDKAINLYRCYLNKSHTNKKRYDPVFWGADAKKYKDRNVDDVGVIAAVVEMGKVEEFAGAEHEFRVPPDGVVKIVRVWKA